MKLIKLVLSAVLAAGTLTSAAGVATADPIVTMEQAWQQRPAQVGASASVTDSDPFYFQVNGRGGYCLDNFASGGGANNSPVGLWTCNGGLTERWRFRWITNNGAYDTLLVNLASGRCLDYPASAGNNIGWQFNVYDCKDGAARGQNFAVTQPNGAGLVFLSQATTHTVAMDALADFWHGNGSPVGLWTYTVPGNSLQTWNITNA